MNLDDELRELFTSDRLDVPVRADAEELIVSGARRLRRRRVVAATASGALAVVVVIAAGIALAGGDPDAMPPATTNPSTPAAATSDEITTLPSTSAAAGPPLSIATTTPTTTQQSPTKTTRTSEPGPPDLNLQVIGPTGFGDVKLGQSVDDAIATGQVGNPAGTTGTGCSVYQLLSDDRMVGYIYTTSSVQAIVAEPVETAEGVGSGWTVEQVKEVYPDLDEQAAVDGGTVTVQVPGYSAANYLLRFSEGKVTAGIINLEHAGQDCGT